ncbi:MAG: hypothetical protein M1812_002636 [Candelaria pacifica]|nr:MAG: hypothetical protein M1812_002636 [Candelaria pacifica]
MEGVIRWSPHSTATQQRFVLLDADHIKLCEIESFHGKTLRYKQTSQHTKFKGARAFDWSPIDEGLVAVGLPSGEATVLRIDDNSNKSYSFPIKNQRWCNTVSLSNKGLLAAGLDKVRNDFCLNIWDIGQHLSSSDTQAAASGQSHAQIEPVRKLSSSEGVTSVRFFADQPDTLVAGVKGQYLRIYDLRESVGNSSVQFTTRCVNNLAIDPNDENYFASASPQGDTTICIWDRRFGSRSSATNLSSGSNANDAGQSGLVLEFKNVIDRANTAVTAKPLIWNTRFSKRKRGCFGLLSSAGELKVIETLKVYSHPNDGAAASEQPGSAPSGGQELYTNRTRNLEYPFYSQQGGRTEKNRIIAFDFINGGDPIDGHRLVTLTADGDIEVRCLQPPGPNIDFGSKGGLLIGLVENGQTRAREISKRQQGMLKHGQPRLALIEPYNPENKAIAETLQIIREKIEDAEIAIDTDAVTITDPLGTTEPHGNFLSSREAHEKLFSHGPSSFRLDITDALVSASVYRQRSQEGYLLKCDENIDIVADDPWLQELWTFIQYAEEDAEENATIYETMDLSYLGIYAIWNNDLGKGIIPLAELLVLSNLAYAGPHPEARRLPSKRDVDHPSLASAVEGLNRRADRPRFDGTKTEFPEHRQYCLALFGWAFTEKDLKSVVEILVDEGKHSKAAAWAMFHNRPKLAMAGLNKGTESHRLLAMGIAGYQNSARANVGGEDDEWTTLCKDIAQSLQDPYSRAILTLVSDGDWNAVVQQESLPLQDRVGVALRFLDDNKLTAVINDFTAEAIRHGDVEGICLTGLTHQAMDLFQSYIVKFGDIQTAVLAMSFTNPRYVNDFRFEHWREWYRDTIDSWKMHIHRVHFDKQSTRKSITSDGRMLAKMPPPQVTLRCNYCSGSLALDAQKDSASGGEKGAADSLSPGDSVTTATDGNPLGGAGASAGTTCPNCKRHLPRCGVCMKWLGTPNPSTAGGAAAAEEAGKMDNFISMCLVCNHGHHLQHARTWFAEHKMCPVPNCQCTCTKHR